MANAPSPLAREYRPRIAAILGKLKLAREEGRSCFGSERHKFELNPPIALGDLADFEEFHRVQLPEDYRAFLALAGNGGAGPYYGINRLESWEGWFDEAAEEFGFLARPCSLVYTDAVSETWKGRLPSNWLQWGTGSMAICDQGCTFEARLIVTGPSRGRIVYLDAQAATQHRPFFVKDPSFLDWYERWLDSVLTGQSVPWFGLDNPDYRP